MIGMREGWSPTQNSECNQLEDAMCDSNSRVNALSDRLDEQLAELEAKQELRCPKCLFLFDDCELLAPHISHHGEDPPKDEICPECYTEFTVEEVVIREFVVVVKE